MVHHWLDVRRRGGQEARGWTRAITLNGVGAVATGTVSLITVVTTFTAGVWVVIVALPLLMALLYGIHRQVLFIDEVGNLSTVDVFHAVLNEEPGLPPELSVDFARGS